MSNCICQKSNQNSQERCTHPAKFPAPGTKSPLIYCGIHKSGTCKSFKQLKQLKQPKQSAELQEIEFTLVDKTGESYEYMLGSHIDWTKYQQPKPNDVILPKSVTYTFKLPYDRDDSKEDDPILYKNIKIKGPITYKLLDENIRKFYDNNPSTDNFDASGMGFSGFELVSSLTYIAHVYY